MMSLLPDKYVAIEYSAVGVASLVLESLQSNDTVSTLWNRVAADDRVRTFDRFADALTILYAANVVELVRGTLRLRRPSGTPP